MTNTEPGYVESAQWLVDSAREWGQGELLQAAKNAELRNTGWPVGIVLSKPGDAPVVTPEGIEVRVEQDKHSDYWSLARDGKFYFIRRLEEDTSRVTGVYPPPPTYVIWWDVRLWRIAEIFLHSAVLYRELGIPADERYMLSIGHRGLNNRAFYVSRPARYLTDGNEICRASTSSWVREVTQDLVLGQLKELVYEVSKELFVLFQFAEVPKSTVDQRVDEFLTSRL